MRELSRNEYLDQLSACLKDVPENERLEALRFVDEYFQEAGEENQQQASADLGLPQDYAKRLMDELPQIPPLPEEPLREPQTNRSVSGGMVQDHGMSASDERFEKREDRTAESMKNSVPTGWNPARIALLAASPLLFVLFLLGAVGILVVLVFMAVGLILLVAFVLICAAVFLSAFAGIPVYAMRMIVAAAGNVNLALFFVGLIVLCAGLLLLSAAVIRGLVCFGIPAYVRRCAALIKACMNRVAKSVKVRSPGRRGEVQTW